MTYLTKDAILSAIDIGYDEVDVPEWGGTVRIRGLSGDERDRYEQSIVTFKGSQPQPKFAGARARLVAWSIVDEKGDRLFNDREVDALGRKSAQALERVYNAARRLSGLTEEDIEELVGNSDSVPSGSSTSD